MLVVDNAVPLPGYCDHVEFKHDGQTVWCLADCNPTVKLLYWDYVKNIWIDVFDLLRDHYVLPGQKIGLGHTFAFGSINIHLGIAYKDVFTGRGGFHHLIISKQEAMEGAKKR